MSAQTVSRREAGEALTAAMGMVLDIVPLRITSVLILGLGYLETWRTGDIGIAAALGKIDVGDGWGC